MTAIAPSLSRLRALAQQVEKAKAAIVLARLDETGTQDAEDAGQDLAIAVHALDMAVDAALPDLLTAAECQEWRLINTAPKGEQVLVAASGDSAIRVAICGEKHGRWTTVPGAYQIHPTHWQPLPPVLSLLSASPTEGQ